MLDIAGKEVLLLTFKEAMEYLLEKVKANYFDTHDKKVKLVKALTAINQAILETKKFIREKGYEENTQLSQLWHNALNACVEADIKDGLPDYLYHKADFWGEPQEWIANPGSLELVPKLAELKRLCDSILVRINK